MSFVEIETELETLSPDELRRLALKSWDVYVAKENSPGTNHDCSEDDPKLLAALDEAIARVGTNSTAGSSGNEVRARLKQWTSK